MRGFMRRTVAGGQQDKTPNAFDFTDLTGQELNTTLNSNTVTITGITGNVSVTASGGLVSINGGAFAASGTITNGQTLQLQDTSSSSFSTQVSMTVTVGTVTADWLITTRAADTTPNAFSLGGITGAEPNSSQSSGIYTVSGLEPNYPFTVSVTGGTVDAGTSAVSGTFAASKSVTSSGTGTLVVQAKGNASASFNTQISVTVTVGTGSGNFNITTRAADTTPNAFSFPAVSGVELNSVNTSAQITVGGLEPNYGPITVAASGGTVDAGTSTLSGTFAASKTVTTDASGNIVVQARGTASSSFSTAVNVMVTVTGTGNNYTITTRAADTTPNAYSFTNASGVNPSSVNTSNTVTVTGLEPNTSVSVSATGGTVDAGTSALSGTFAASKTVTTSGTGTLVVAAQGTASASFNTSTTVTVSVGTGSGTYTITTRLATTTPSGQTAFTDISGANPSVSSISNTVTVSGLEPNYSYTVGVGTTTGGTPLIDAGTSALSGSYASSKTATTSGTGTLVLAIQMSSSSSFSTTATGYYTLTCTGGSSYSSNGSNTYDITTRAPDITPNAYSFTAASGVEPNSTNTSAQITVGGLEPNYSVSVTATGGLVDAGTSALSGTFSASTNVTTSGTGTLVVAARVTASSSFSTAASVTIAVGTGSASYSATTRAADTTPNAYSFTAASNVNPGATSTSNTVTVTGLEPNYPLTLTTANGLVDAGTSALSGTFAGTKNVTTSGTGTLVIAAQGTANAAFNGTTTVTIFVGTGSGDYVITTRAADTTPTSPANFTSSSGNVIGTVVTSNTQTFTGMEVSYSSVTVSGSNGSTVDAGTSALSGTFAASKSVTTSASGSLVAASQVTASSEMGTTITGSVQVGTAAVTHAVSTGTITTHMRLDTASPTLITTGSQFYFQYSHPPSSGLVTWGSWPGQSSWGLIKGLPPFGNIQLTFRGLNGQATVTGNVYNGTTSTTNIAAGTQTTIVADGNGQVGYRLGVLFPTGTTFGNQDNVYIDVSCSDNGKNYGTIVQVVQAN